MIEERKDRLKLSLNLKNLMKGRGTHIPDIFMLDPRLNAYDRQFIGILLRLVQEDGTCMPTGKELAYLLDCNTEENIWHIKNHLWELEYLTWDPMPKDKRRWMYEFTIPYDSAAWMSHLKWDKFFASTEEFVQYVGEILTDVIEPGIPKYYLGKILLPFINNTNKDNNIRRSKIPKSRLGNSKPHLGGSKSIRDKRLAKVVLDKRKPKNGRKEEACLLDSDSKYFEDNPQGTHNVISSYIAWLNHRSGGNGNKHFGIERNSTYYKYFVHLRKRLLEFRGNRNSPNLQTLFWDYFRIISQEHDRLGWTQPHITQLSGDGTWLRYVNYIADNFPSNSYWWDTEFQIEAIDAESLAESQDKELEF